MRRASNIGVTMLLVLPFIVFIQSAVGVPRYLAGLTSQAREITTLRVNGPPVRFDWTKPLVHIDPPTERRINVRGCFVTLTMDAVNRMPRWQPTTAASVCSIGGIAFRARRILMHLHENCVAPVQMDPVSPMPCFAPAEG